MCVCVCRGHTMENYSATKRSKVVIHSQHEWAWSRSVKEPVTEGHMSWVHLCEMCRMAQPGSLVLAGGCSHGTWG